MTLFADQAAIWKRVQGMPMKPSFDYALVFTFHRFVNVLIQSSAGYLVPMPDTKRLKFAKPAPK